MNLISLLGPLIYLPLLLTWSSPGILKISPKIQKQEVIKDTSLILELNRKAEGLRYKKSDSIGILAKEALALSEKIEYEKGIIYSYYNLALHELYQGNTSRSLEFYTKNTDNPNLNKYPSLAIKLYNDIAQAYFIRAEHPKAFEAFIKAKNIAETTNNSYELIRLNSNLGTLFSLLEDYEEAIKYYNEAFSKIDDNTPDYMRSLIFANLGYLNLKQNKLDSALEYLEKGIKYAGNTDYSTIIAFNYISLGDLYNLKKEYAKGLEYYEKAQTEYLKNGDKKGTADLYYGIAESYKGLKEYTISKKYAVKSLDLYKSFSLKSGLEKCYRLLYELSKIKNDLSSSLFNLERAEVYSDSISKEQNKTNISMLQAKLAYAKEKKELQQISTSTISKQRSYIIGSSTFLILAIIIILVIYQSNKKRQQLIAVLAEKTKVLSENEQMLNETNKTKDKLFSIVGHDLRGPIVSLRGLLKLSLEVKNGESQFKRFGPKLLQDLDHIQFTLDNLLNWGQTQMQGANIKPIRIIVKNEIEDINKLFNESLAKKKISIINDIEEEMCACADLNHFRIIFRNLISNAVKFTETSGTIKIDGKEEENMLTISVIDNGIGIMETDIDKIWKNKEHFSKFGTHMEKGTGLGLSLCKEMVEKNKGTIGLKSIIDEGTTFYVCLPVCDS